MELELALDPKAILGEGALWDVELQRLWWVNIMEGELHRFDPVTGQDEVFAMGQMIGTVVKRRQGGVAVALENGFGGYDPADRQLTMWCDPEADAPQRRFNDGKCDPAGRFWAGTMEKVERRPTGALYCLEPNHDWHRRVEDVTVSNGIVWTSDSTTMYYIDTPTRRVDAFDFDVADGRISNRRPVINVAEELGKPDGMTIDAEDCVWVAMWGGSCVMRFDPRTGRQLAKIDVPSSNVTSCALGGPALNDLYITTARNRVSDEELVERPHSGSLFRVRVEVPGVPAVAFAG